MITRLLSDCDVYIVQQCLPEQSSLSLAVCRSLRMAESIISQQKLMDEKTRVLYTYEIIRRPLY